MALNFPDMTFSHFMRLMYGGLKFDISGILFLNSVYIILYLIPFPFRYHSVYQSILKWLFFLSNGFALALNTADFFYFEFILKRSTADVFMFATEGNILTLLGLFIIDYWRGVVFWLLMITIMGTTYKLVKAKKAEPMKKIHF